MTIRSAIVGLCDALRALTASTTPAAVGQQRAAIHYFTSTPKYPRRAA